MFRWIVQHINKSLGQSQSSVNFIGVIDIAGFEIFQKNSYEQLLINYTNEKLHQLFKDTMFVEEQKEYLDEGLEWKFIDFGLNSQPVIDLIEKPNGVLGILNDVCRFGRGNDKTLSDRLRTSHYENSKFIDPTSKALHDFSIVHYAGVVDYSVDGWTNKNNSGINQSVVEILANSENEIMADIWRNSPISSMTDANGGKETGHSCHKTTHHTSLKTVAQDYKHQLSDLITLLSKTKIQFVRCLKPNYEKVPEVFDPLLILEQIRCNGVSEAIKISCEGYPTKIPIHDFYERYGKWFSNRKPSNLKNESEFPRRYSLMKKRLKICKTFLINQMKDRDLEETERQDYWKREKQRLEEEIETERKAKDSIFNSRKQLEKNFSDMNAKFTSCQSENEMSKKTLWILKESNSNLRTEIGEVNAEKDGYYDEIASLKLKVTDLEQKVEHSKKFNEDCEKEKEKLESEKRQLAVSVENYRTLIHGLETKKKELENEIEVETLKNRNESENKKKIERIQKEYDENRKQLRKREEEAVEKESQLKILKNSVKAANETIDSLRKKEVEDQRRLLEYQAENEIVKAKYEGINERFTKLQSAQVEEKNKLDDARRQIRRLISEKDMLRMEKESLQKMFDKLRQSKNM
ncbi:unnamed protein product [Caenorhabditis angaria]|uniref:Myosin motor domain-containing protein n=1 Tax=Caenorhabditis angaria TaxID=860376 RepID=A0A9P1ITQ9_9PELO|nr:unnamed protein product [Caenorhabditis angaria]